MIQSRPDLVYLILPWTFLHKNSSGKFRIVYNGPLVVHKIMDNFQYILMDIGGKIMNGI